MSKKIIINASMAEEIRIAIVENNKLIDLDLEISNRTKNKGNIYKGIVSNIQDSLDAAFIDFGEIKHAFLPLSEIRSLILPDNCKNNKKIKISDVLTRGQEVIIQITKDEISNKGAAITTYLSLAGRYSVLMHSDESKVGISRKIQDEKSRQHAKDILSSLKIQPGMAVIIRTEGTTCAVKDVVKDFELLCETWKKIDKSAQLGRAPTLLYKEPDIVIRTIRDYFSKDIKKIVIDDEEEFQEASSFFKKHIPNMINIVEHYKKKEPIFQFYGIEKEINELSKREVKLSSGGYLIIEQTEALVSIDVNSGSSNKEQDHEATVYKTNMEASVEIVRQLRLRDLGGIIIIDFIDMILKKHKYNIEKNIYELMQLDKARVKIGRIGENGTLELTRQRIRQSHRLISHVLCNKCNGTGRIRDEDGLAILALRQISGYLSKKRIALSILTVKLPIEISNIINNKKRREIIKLCELYDLELEILSDQYLTNDSIEFKESRRGQAGLDAAHKESIKRKNNQSQLNKWGNQVKNTTITSIGEAPKMIEEKIIKNKTSLNHNNIFFEDQLTQALFGSIKLNNKKLQ